MFVPSYQMHNVLNVYSKKLRHNLNSKDQNLSSKLPADRVDLTTEGKRRATIEKVTKEIYNKILRSGSQANSSHREPENIKGNLGNESASAKPKKTDFVYNVIDAINKKTTSTVSAEDSSFLIQRLEQLSRDRVEIKRNNRIEDHGEINNPIP